MATIIGDRQWSTNATWVGGNVPTAADAQLTAASGAVAANAARPVINAAIVSSG